MMIPNVGGPRLRAAIKYVGLAALVCLMIPIIYAIPRKPRPVDLSLPLRILPLGDSITWGWQPSAQVNGTNGYRACLHYELVYAHYESVDFVGTQHSGLMFDNDNEGHAGLTIRQIQSAMGKGLEMRPNIVLLHAGTNDLSRPETKEERWKDAPKRLGSLIDEVLRVCPDAVVFVARLIQAERTQTRANIKTYNDIVTKMVQEREKKGAKLVLVDQSVVEPKELVDGLHPSYAGYDHMGYIWFQAVKYASEKGLITPPIQL